jgi:FAD dependent monooxygenase
VTRQQLLEVLYTGLGERAKETVHGGAEVTKICHEGDVVKVHTRAGNVYTGDLVVGADGLHSIARSEILKIVGRNAIAETSSERPSSLSLVPFDPPPQNKKREWQLIPYSRTDLTADYRVHVGLSTSVPGLSTGEQIIRSYDGFALFVFCGKDGEVGWFATEKLNRRYTYPERPGYTEEDAMAYCESLSDVNVWGDIKFGAVWKARTSFSHALVDEHVFSTWNYGRVVCVGDSVVKVRILPIVKDDLQAYKLMLWQL